MQAKEHENVVNSRQCCKLLLRLSLYSPRCANPIGHEKSLASSSDQSRTICMINSSSQ